jgi:hypothetical protein
MKQFFQRRFHALKTTQRRGLRKTAGVLLVIGGILGFLPVLGYWMLPLGLALLAVDFPLARRLNRRVIVWWEYKRRRLSGDKSGSAVDSVNAREKKNKH